MMRDQRIPQRAEFRYVPHEALKCVVIDGADLFEAILAKYSAINSHPNGQQEYP